jgi:VanZ family protein
MLEARALVDGHSVDKAAEPRPWSGPRLRWLVWGVYVVIWSVALLRPEPAHVSEVVFPEHETRFLAAKSLHVGAYALFAILSAWLPVPRRWRWLLIMLISAHGMATEFFQQFVPDRSASWRDVGFDHVGLVLGVLLSWKWWRRP